MTKNSAALPEGLPHPVCSLEIPAGFVSCVLKSGHRVGRPAELSLPGTHPTFPPQVLAQLDAQETGGQCRRAWRPAFRREPTVCLPLGECVFGLEGASFYSREKVPALCLGLRPRRGLGDAPGSSPGWLPGRGPGTGAPCPRPRGCHPSRPGLCGLHHRPPSFRACPGGQASPGATWVAAGPELKYEGSRMRSPHLLPWPLRPPAGPAPPPRNPTRPPRSLASCGFPSTPGPWLPPTAPRRPGLPRPLHSQVPLPKCLSTLTGV